MASLLGGYASHYNRRHNRVGYVFQNRYKSILCDADAYFLALVRYIHLNPHKAKLTKSLGELDRYRWTGHSAILGKHPNDWQNVMEVLQQFGRQRKHAIQRYRQFIERGIRDGVEDLSGGGLIRSYQGWEHIKALRKEHEIRIGDERILGTDSFSGKPRDGFQPVVGIWRS